MAVAMLRKPTPPAISTVEDRLRIAKDHRLPFEQRWALNQAFYEARQWVYYNRSRGRVETPPAPAWRVRHTANYITPMVYTLLAKISRKRPDMTARPSTGEEQDVNAAKRATQLLDYLWGELGLTQKRYQLTIWALLCGKAFFKTYWDRSAGPTIQDVDPETGEPIVFRLGQVAVDVVSPYELAVDPAADTTGGLDGAQWVVHEKILSVEEIEAKYDVKVSPENIDAASMGQDQEGSFGLTGGDESTSAGGSRKLDHHAIIKEYWERPCEDYEDGRLIVVASGQLLYDDAIPYRNGVEEPDLPFTEFSHVLVPGKFWCKGLVEDLIPPQKAINVALSKLMEIQNLMAMPKIIVQEGSIDPGKWTSEPGQQVMTRGGIPPQIWAPQVFPQGVFELVNLHLETMYKISGVREFSLSGAPSGAHSGVALSLLSEQDETRLGPVVDLIEDGLARTGTKMLQIVQGDGTDQSPYGYTEPRQLRVTGENGLIEVVDFNASDIKHVDVEVEAGSTLPKSKAAQAQYILDLAQAGMLQNVPPDRILDMLDLGSLDSQLDESRLDTVRAEFENRKMQQGMIQLPHPWENHGKHIDEHNKFRKQDQYEQLPPLIQQMFEAHVEQHKAMMVAQETERAQMQAAPQMAVAMMAAQAQAAAAPPQALPPPGGPGIMPGSGGLPPPVPPPQPGEPI